ncbi:hypothetical protein V6N13_065523 [Hibiscus sabdariffa]
MRRVDTSERAGSPISATVHPLHKKGRSDNNLASVDDIAMDIGLDPLTGDVNVSARSRTTPFKDKLLGEVERDKQLSGYCGRVERISDDDVKGLQARQNRGTGLVKKRGKAVTLQHEGSESSREENRGAHDLWAKLVKLDALNRFFTSPFDDWLKENIRVKSHPASTTVDWSVRFSIFCWLLWKARCSEILGDRRSARESIFVRGQ